MKKRYIFLLLAGLAVAPAIPAFADAFKDFWRFITQSATATGPYSATDWVPLIRGNQTFRTSAANFAPAILRKPNPSGGFFISTTGNDADDCLAATVGSGHGPCLTGQHVATLIMSEYDSLGSNFVVHVAAGNYNWTVVASGSLGGSASTTAAALQFIGAGSTATFIDATGAGCGSYGHVFTASNSITLGIGSMEVSTTCNGGSVMFCQNGAQCYFVDGDIKLGRTPYGSHIHLEDAQFELPGAYGYTITGEAASHVSLVRAFFNGDPGTRAITITGTPDFPAGFVLAQDQSFYGLGQGLTFNWSGVTGPRAVLQGMSDAHLLGATKGAPTPSATYLPGNKFVQASVGSVLYPMPQPVIGSFTGLGTGGAMVLTDGTTYAGGTILLNTGSAATAASGNFDMSIPVEPFNFEARCVVTPAQGFDGVGTARIRTQTFGDASTLPVINIGWDTNGAALSTGQTYAINFGCTQW